ncbi:serine/threonine-protein phosphatase PGAM5, partial [Mytilus galloprovincialis]
VKKVAKVFSLKNVSAVRANLTWDESDNPLLDGDKLSSSYMMTKSHDLHFHRHRLTVHRVKIEIKCKQQDRDNCKQPRHRITIFGISKQVNSCTNNHAKEKGVQSKIEGGTMSANTNIVTDMELLRRRFGQETRVKLNIPAFTKSLVNLRSDLKGQLVNSHLRIILAFRRCYTNIYRHEKRDNMHVSNSIEDVFSCFCLLALQLPPEAWLRFYLNHGSITWLTVGPNGQVGLKTLGETGFMPANVTFYSQL